MSNDISQNNKRIAKNTLALYFRTFITMIVGLYTGRVMLHALGIDNYGVNNVVGGIVGMSSLITTAMSQGISRYLTCAIGTGDKEKLRIVFSTSINVQIMMAVIVAAILEIASVWFINSAANIPEGRMVAANWVLQCSIVILMITLICSPFNALLIAHERMKIYAYVGIIDVILKLMICYAIMVFSGDRLILLAVLQILVTLGMQIFYGWYCGRNFEEAKYNSRLFDRGILKELTVFSSWNFISHSSYVFATQGVNMLVNVFFGVAYNAARGIAMQVNSAVQGFVSNFVVAFSPQITKSYAADEKEYAVHLSNRGTKFSWIMMYIFIVPVCVEADMLLKLWLGEVPEMAVLFLRFAMFESLAVSSGGNLYRLIQADGHIRMYTIHAAVTAGLVFPITWILFYLGAPVWIAYLVFIISFLLLNIIRIYDIKHLMIFSIRQYLKECIIPCMIISITSFIIPIIIVQFMEQSIIRFFVNVTVSVLWTCLCCYLFGLTKNERCFLKNKLCEIIAKYYNKE